MKRAKTNAIEDELLAEFARGELPSDRLFDLLLPPGPRSHSRLHWTPVRVAAAIAEFLAPSAESRVLDVGSGCGKFACVGALTSPGRFYGIEQRPPLHEAALELSSRLGLKNRATFSKGDALAADWSSFTGIYLFNPLGENLWSGGRADTEESRMLHQYNLFAKSVAHKLAGLSVGTVVATYHGFGAQFPASFRQIHSMDIGKGPIEIWAKES